MVKPSAVGVLVLSAWGLVSCQYVPPSPCPNIFTYKTDGQYTYGLIRYQPPGQLKHVFVRADFVIGAQLPSDYTGELEVQGSKAAILLRMLRGQSLEYRVEFPLPSPLPTLAALTVNSLVICSGQPETTSTSESYSLEHLLFDKGDGDLSLLVVGKTGANRPTSSPPPLPLTATSNETECGTVSGGNKQVELVHMGEAVTPGKWPWLVAIYAKTRFGINYICAGSLVSNQHVITAAHCMSRLGVVKAKEDFVLKLGAFNLDNTNDPQVVTRGVKSAAIHFYYDSHTLANDLLILFLDSPIMFTTYIKPVCLWEGAIDLNAIISKYGTVVGWGGNELRESGTGEPRMASLPVVSTETCRSTRKEFHDLTSRTTICVGNRNGTGPCNGDSGGGLYMLSGGRWRLRGLVSVSLRPATGEAKCNLQEYVVLTDVAQYLPWVRQHLAGIAAPSLPLPIKGSTVQTQPQPASHPDAAGAAGCGVVAGGNERVPLLYHGYSISHGDWPWLAAIYLQIRGYRIAYICTGTLISDQHVITAGQCYSDHQLIVKLGAFNLSSSNEPSQVGMKVSKATPHDLYDRATNMNNILILTLEKPVRFTTYIRPVCFWEKESDPVLVGEGGIVVGWGRNAINRGELAEPAAASFPVVSTETCVESLPEVQRYTYNNTFCAGYTNGTRLCNGDSGGGLYMLSGGRWRLRGISYDLLALITVDDICSLQEYALFTDVTEYLPWIRKHANLEVQDDKEAPEDPFLPTIEF